MGDDCYQDEAYHLLTADIVFFGSVYMSEEEFKETGRLPQRTPVLIPERKPQQTLA